VARTLVRIRVESGAFEHGGQMPVRHTRDGENASPPLAWSGVPDGAKSIVVICEDRDVAGGPFVHWVLYNLPPDLPGLPAGGDGRGASQGLNDFGEIGYDGPQPPPGSGLHHYHFLVYALDTLIDPRDGMTKMELFAAMRGHVLAQGELIGTYSR
jgi:Raf kinase inhibitor-like YbhB/YbcL family protein